MFLYVAAIRATDLICQRRIYLTYSFKSQGECTKSIMTIKEKLLHQESFNTQTTTGSVKTEKSQKLAQVTSNKIHINTY